jgi:hypothetical protein
MDYGACFGDQQHINVAEYGPVQSEQRGHRVVRSCKSAGWQPCSSLPQDCCISYDCYFRAFVAFMLQVSAGEAVQGGAGPTAHHTATGETISCWRHGGNVRMHLCLHEVLCVCFQTYCKLSQELPPGATCLVPGALPNLSCNSSHVWHAAACACSLVNHNHLLLPLLPLLLPGPQLQGGRLAHQLAEVGLQDRCVESNNSCRVERSGIAYLVYMDESGRLLVCLTLPPRPAAG